MYESIVVMINLLSKTKQHVQSGHFQNVLHFSLTTAQTGISVKLFYHSDDNNDLIT